MSSVSAVANPLFIPNDVRSWVEIDLAALRHNAGVARELAGPHAELIGVVKADAYGHGVAATARSLADLVAIFGVANFAEAQELLELGLGKEILLLSPCLPAERKAAIEAAVICSISSAEEAEGYARDAGARKALLNFKVDTGMGRMGCWQDEAAAELRRIVKLPGIEVRMISTHLPVADEDKEYTTEQIARFEKLAGELRQIAPGAKTHVLNSGGALGFHEHSFDFFRVGLMLYGSASPTNYQAQLRAALTWKARIILVREVAAGRSLSYGRTFTTTKSMRVATLPVGYADGFPRQASGHGAQVLVGGKRCAVLGRVTMDQILVDVTDVPEAREGDEAVIVGVQGGDEIFAAELAEHAGTIAWDIFTGIKHRVQRLYLSQPLTAKA